MSSSAPVARAFFVVHVAHDHRGAPVPAVAARATYGIDGGEGTHADAELVKVATAKHFCFPEFVAAPGASALDSLAAIVPTERMKPEQYTFCLTEGDGSRTIGFCRRSLPPGAGPRYPVVTCILTLYPWFSYFFTALVGPGPTRQTDVECVYRDAPGLCPAPRARSGYHIINTPGASRDGVSRDQQDL
jgi:hypothetical protein